MKVYLSLSDCPTGILKCHHITYQTIHLSPFAVSRPLQIYWRALLLEDETWLQDASSTSWAVFHARSQSSSLYQDTSVMLQIFRHDSKSATNIRHLLDVLIKSIHYLNPNQTAVIGFDQPLYTLAKKIQWFQLTAYGQQKLVLMLGTLHIKMVMLICLGKWLQDSG